MDLNRNKVPYGIYQQALKNHEAAKAQLGGTEALNEMLQADNTKLQLQNKELVYQIESQREAFRREYTSLQEQLATVQNLNGNTELARMQTQ